jgi:hypothetical protein
MGAPLPDPQIAIVRQGSAAPRDGQHPFLTPQQSGELARDVIVALRLHHC